MKRTLLLPVSAAIASLAFAASASAAGPEAVSENWSGYEAQSTSGSGYSAVSGGWVQPAANCTGGSSTYSAFWVGIGGGSGSSQALEQTGTQADCQADGSAVYYAWYELVPTAPVKIPMTVNPGDHMYGRVNVSGTSVTVTIQDQTTGASFSKTLSMTDPSPDTSSAEWIAEAPSECSSDGQCQPLPLSDFGTVKFTSASATADGHTGSVSDSNWTAQPVALESQSSNLYGYGAGGYGAYTSGDVGSANSGSAGAAPSSLSSDGTSFTVSYESSGASQPSSGGYGYGYGGYGYGGYGYPDGYGSGWYGYGSDAGQPGVYPYGY